MLWRKPSNRRPGKDPGQQKKSGAVLEGRKTVRDYLVRALGEDEGNGIAVASARPSTVWLDSRGKVAWHLFLSQVLYVWRGQDARADARHFVHVGGRGPHTSCGLVA